ncbi:hypothetical protein KX729_25765 [Rhizobium sp. XQZ8]|uniref:hypothetical protein n=1 Tax=Rhizobium populisoli TaxID=2859785 RepID=UPI001CA58218|nr:hypothetical protein [Rhizobium populisoli]MBW6424860.1 hypothetical protein [Rhizobium populisoli]
MAHAVANGDESGGSMLPTDEIDRPERIKVRIEALLELVEDKPGLVFWIGGRSLSEDEIYRHLRSINRILIERESEQDLVGDSLSALPGAANSLWRQEWRTRIRCRLMTIMKEERASRPPSSAMQIRT